MSPAGRSGAEPTTPARPSKSRSDRANFKRVTMPEIAI